MNSLLGVNINWSVFFILAFITILIPGITIFSFCAILLTLHQFLLLFYSIGYIIPTRYLFGFLMCLQLLLGPTLAYNVDIAKIQMRIPQAEYFSYVIPAVICFIIGLHISCRKLEGEVLDEEKIKAYITSNKNPPFVFIGIGFLASYISDFF